MPPRPPREDSSTPCQEGLLLPSNPPKRSHVCRRASCQGGLPVVGQVPLMEHKTTLEAYRAWEASLSEGLQRELPATVMQGYQRAAAAVELRLASETALGPGHAADADLLAAYLAYVKLEQAGAWLFRLYGRGPGVLTTKTQPNPSSRTGLSCSSLLTRQQHWAQKLGPQRRISSLTCWS